MRFYRLFIVLFLSFNLAVALPGLYLYADPGEQIDLEKMKKEEEERRKKTKKSKYTFTNEDLKRMKDSKEKVNITEVVPSSDKETAAGKKNKAKQGDKIGDTKKDPKKTEKYWRALKNNLEKKIREVENLIKQNEFELAGLRNQYYAMDILSERLQIQKEIDQTFNAIKNHKRGLEILKKNLEELYQKARRAGVPPGWLRD